MSSSRNTSDLFALAREDAPSSTAREAVWERVAVATAAPVAAAAAAKVAAPIGSKLAATTALVAVAAAATALALLLRPGIERSADAVQRRAPAVVTRGAAAGARLADPAPRAHALTSAAVPSAAAPVRGSTSSVSAGPAENVETAAAARQDEGSALAEEARLVTEARRALVRGEAERTIALVESTRRLPVRALEPEELALAARALRLLGRSDEALATELTLRRRFPSHALSR